MYGYIDGMVTKTKTRGRPSQFSDEQMDEMRQMREEGKSLAQIAEHFGSNTSTVHYALSTRPKEAGPALPNSSEALICTSSGEQDARVSAVHVTRTEPADPEAAESAVREA